MSKNVDVCFRTRLFLCLATLLTIARAQQSLLQAWTKSQKIHTMTKLPELQTSNTTADSINLAQRGHGLKFYMPSIGKACKDIAFPTAKIVPEHGPLKDVGSWLWVVKEEGYDKYVQHRLACSNSLVPKSEDADLCYPTCAPAASLMSKADEGWMAHVCFEVPASKRDSWSGCSNLCLGPESLGKCSVEVPYLHGIMWPEQTDNQPIATPWDFNFERTTMLAFVGGEQRGWFLNRGEAIRSMQAEASKINAAAPEKVFSARIIQEPKDRKHQNDWYDYGRTQDFYLDTWGLYASANFSWQPFGDTSTRRALYDSVMFGCVPVIDTRAAYNYRHLFNGTLWKDVALEKVFVVIPEGKELDGNAILQLLVSMPEAEVDTRRSSLRKIASALQWGEQTPNGGDALLTALRSVRSGPPFDEH